MINRVTELKDWQKALVIQKDRKFGAIPAGFEWMIKFNQINDINFDSFQDDFNFQIRGMGKNNFHSIGIAVEKKYPHIKIKYQKFDDARKKIAFIKNLIDKNIPCMMNFAVSLKQSVTHEMPVVNYEIRLMRFIWLFNNTSNPDIIRVEYEDIINRHNKWVKGREVAWLEPI